VNPTRLVAIDLDGTLVGEDLKVSDVDAAAIERATADGIEVCIATGRLFSAARPFAEELGLSGFLIPLNGAAVFETLTGEMVRAVPLDVDVARIALDALRERRFRVQLYFGDRLYLDGVDERTEAYLRLARVEPVMVPDLRELLVGRAPPEPGPMKVLGIGAEADVLEQVAQLGAKLGAKANVFRSLRQYLEVTDPRADKASALAWVAAQRGLAAAQVAAIGDSDNDAPMLAWAGRSYAVAGATPLAIASAKRVVGATGTGVAMALADLLADAAYERA
jgi:Cof subfamily protein (haloacid dehalogenase superfamily)